MKTSVLEHFHNKIRNCFYLLDFGKTDNSARADPTDLIDNFARLIHDAILTGREMVGAGGLEPPAFALSERRSNQLSYAPFAISTIRIWWRQQDLNLRPPACKAGALAS